MTKKKKIVTIICVLLTVVAVKLFTIHPIYIDKIIDPLETTTLVVLANGDVLEDSVAMYSHFLPQFVKTGELNEGEMKILREKIKNKETNESINEYVFDVCWEHYNEYVNRINY